MSLDQIDTVDAIGTERETGEVILTILDGRDWSDERGHLTALQSKLNSYFGFVESGQLSEIEPTFSDGGVRIDVVFRYNPTAGAIALLQTAEFVVRPLNIKISHKVYSGR
jgi:hypothetical protein